MVRQIKLNQIDDVMKEVVVDLVQATTLEWTARTKKATPVFSGTITNNLPYAEPVCFGINLPPTWGGQYKTRQGTVPGFPELIAKELTTNYIPRQLARIVRKK